MSRNTDPKTTFCMRIPKELKLEFKIACVEQGLEMTLVAEQQISKWLRDRKKKAK